MKTYPQTSKHYEIAEKIVNRCDADLTVEKLAKIQSAGVQIAVIDTMYQIVLNDSAHRNTKQADMLAVQIRNGQRERISRFGEKAFGLSEKQLGVIARDLAKIAVRFED